MIGHSMTLEQLKKLDNFDRIRRSYIDKTPISFALIGLTICYHFFSLTDNLATTIALILFGCGLYVKNLFLYRDDNELFKVSKNQKHSTKAEKV